MSEIVVNAEARTSMKKHAKYSRWEGKIPGVYYARGEETAEAPGETPPVPADDAENEHASVTEGGAR